MNALKMCLNWKVIAGVVALGIGFFVFAPNLAAAALPFLVLAICPLSMLLMMGAMNNAGNGSQTGATCAMDGQRPKNREEQLAQLKMQQQALTDQIAALEQADLRAETRAGAQAATPTS